MTYTTLVSTDVLAAHLGAWVVVDCRYDLHDEEWGRGQYRFGHVPGAAYASLGEDLAGERTGTNGRHPVPPVEHLAALFGRLGIERGRQVVVYDQDTGLFASRLWWSLRYLGHDDVALLDGGWAKWTREGRPSRRGDESPRAAIFNPQPRPHLCVGVADVEAGIARGSALLIDARGPERFEGRDEPIDRVGGHIPGAANHFYKWNLAGDGTMLPPERLRERYEALLGGRAPAEAIVYCGSGVSACHDLLAMEHAGLSGTPLYPGSWSEWSSVPERPVETGPSRR
jgi:thiosulfate/3-mercaptopyruvate sulfurtransferase